MGPIIKKIYKLHSKEIEKVHGPGPWLLLWITPQDERQDKYVKVSKMVVSADSW